MSPPATSCRGHASRWVRLALSALCFALGALHLGAMAAYAQTKGYCTVTDVEVVQLSNAVRITLKADGALRVEVDEVSAWEQSEEGGWQMKKFDVIEFRLPNARSNLGSFVDISAYPISYLKLAIPLESQEGIGLECGLVLYRPAVYGRVRADNYRSGGRWLRGDVQVDIEKADNGRELYLTVTSGKHVDLTELEKKPKPKHLERRLSVKKGASGRLSVHALNADLREALKQISEQSGVALVVDNAVTSNLSCHLTDMELDPLLQRLARACGLVVARQQDTYYASDGVPTSVASYWLSSTETIPLHYLTATEALPLLPDYILRYVHSNKAGNALVATGPPELLQKLRADIAKVDKRGMGIRVRSVLVEFHNGTDAERTLKALVATGNTEASLDSADADVRFAVLRDRLSAVQAEMKWRRRGSKTTMYVNPTVRVRSGETAEVFFGQKLYFKFTREGWRGPEVIIESTDIGVRLRATPWGAKRDYIMVPLTLEASSLVSVGAGGLPTVATRRAYATLALKSGQTVIVGGLRVRQSGRSRQRTPLAMMLGPLGRSTQRNVIERKALILLQVDAVS